MYCKCCKEEIADGASICKHCGAHQGLILRRLSEWSNVGIVISAILLILSILQFYVASREKSKAEQAERMAGEAQKRIEAHEKLVIALRFELEKTKDMAELGDLTLRAESGERQALVKLIKRSRDDNWILTTITEKNLNRVWARFKGMEISDPALADRINSSHFLMQNRESIERYLSSPQYETRAEAVDAVYFLKLNVLIPRIINVGISDSDLHVVQVACNTLNKLLLEPDAEWQLQETGGSALQPLSIYDFVVAPEKTAKDLRAKWENRKDRLLAVQPKYWKSVGDGKLTLIDPEQGKKEIRDKQKVESSQVLEAIK